MNTWSKKNISSGTVLIGAMMFANALNFIFNAFLGRVLSFEEFGLITFVNTIWAITAIFLSAFGNAINHSTAYFSAKFDRNSAAYFLKRTRKKSLIAGILFALLFWALSPVMATFFRIPDMLPFLILSPIIILGIATAANRGYLQGNFSFKSVSAIVMAEAVTKLIAAGVLYRFGFQKWVYLSIPISLVAAFLTALAFSFRKANLEKIPEQHLPELGTFPKGFYFASLLAGLSATAFLSFDIVLIKHYLTPDLAGKYAFLSLIGKMIYFLSSLFSGLMITFVSYEMGGSKSSNKTFRRFFGLTALLVVGAFVVVGPLGFYTVPLLFGAKAFVILPFLVPYGLAIAFYSLSQTVAIYHLARREYIFPIAAVCMSLVMSAGIILFHSDIEAVITVMLFMGLANLFLMSALHVLKNHGRFAIRNVIDFLDAFYPLLPVVKENPAGKNILIFNWRDLKHKFAGGAEVYIEELARRFVTAGHQVTLFCGNDGQNPRNEVVEGVRIIRRGGFYFVYVWAFLYYLTKFRGRFDLIIDAQNGVPFFTPLYAKEPVYCVLHHVHQEIFYKYLPRPLAVFAAFLENTVMPWAYRDTKFITISESTLKDMKKLRLGLAGTKIISPGINLQKLKPGEKSKNPTVLYLGRLKAYKSIDVLIRAFKEVLQEFPKANLSIAGFGEEAAKLKKLAHELGLKKEVEFLGKVSEDEKIGLMQKAWVFVNPSCMEGWGITTVEANACGTPVVASNVPGLRDSVSNPHTGFLVEYGRSDAFAEKIILLMKDKKLNEEKQRNAIKWAQNFDWEKSSIAFLKILDATEKRI